MEGPSLVIACEELNFFKSKKILQASGSAKLPFDLLTHNKLIKAQSWGKHLLLTFKGIHLRIHFLMFGSYRIDQPRENRIAKLILEYPKHKVYFYSCAIKVITTDDLKLYDFSSDLMSKTWSASKALQKLTKKPDSMVCDLLMDQTIFSGLGNIMKNEILFKLHMHPETRIKDLDKVRIQELVRESKRYASAFYRWKKKNELKKNWKIMRKKTCPIDGTKVIKKPTGKLMRMSHFCKQCQFKK